MQVGRRRTKPRLLAPEVVQTSAMDCGPASLKCLLEGFGIPISYGRLREACQTDVDGTSIDTMEEIAVQLGLNAEQIMIPPDHVFLAESGSLPAIAVIRLPNQATHFVVLWRCRRGLVQIMDPGTGRHWVSERNLRGQLYVHSMPVPAEAWREWAASKDFLGPLRRRLADIGMPPRTQERRIAFALSDPGWRGLATLDASTRMVSAVVRAGGLRRGRQAATLLRSFLERAHADTAETTESIPAAYWSVRPGPAASGDEAEEQILLRGAVLVRVRGPLTFGSAPDEVLPEGVEAPEQPALSPELAAALKEPKSRPGRQLLRFLRADGLLTPFSLGLALILAGLGVIVEALLLRGSLELGADIGLIPQRIGGAALLLSLVGGLLLLNVPIQSGLLRMGRGLEVRLRIAFLAKIPRLGDRYFQSRLTSDMAERSHSVHALRELPLLGGRLLRATSELALTTAGIIWLAPESLTAVLVAVLVSLAVPVLVQPPLRERDLRLRTHVGALSRFYLDGLLGLVPARTHGAEPSIRRGHEGLLVDWMESGLSLQRMVVIAEAVQALAGYGVATLLLFSYLSGGGELSAVLLLVYWALNLPVLGQEIALVARLYPSLRNVTLRLLEPLGALEEHAHDERRGLPGSEPTPTDAHEGVAVTFQDVVVRATGHTILDGIDLHIEAGGHVAVVGQSGAGKSSLVGVLLGWHRAARGRVLIDGQPLDSGRLERLRREVAWVEPAVQLWNRSLYQNLIYGRFDGQSGSLAHVIQEADLRRLLESLPAGLQTPLGEGGALVSGGEGQRVRLGRAMARSGVRLVILDEPFRGLDRDRRRELLARARRWWRDATLICITHDVGQTATFDRVLVIDDGRLVEDGQPAQLREEPSSHYFALLQAEEAVRTTLWSGAEWRRIWLDAGRLQPTHARPPGGGDGDG